MNFQATIVGEDVDGVEEEEESEEEMELNFTDGTDIEFGTKKHSMKTVLEAQQLGDTGKTVDQRVSEILKRKKGKESNSERPRKKRKLAGGPKESTKSWEDLRLSKPLLKALSDLGFERPTPIQVAAIQPSLLNQDILASAQTGSGKTAAFILPVLERMVNRPKSELRTRVLVLTPTRELAAQCYEMTAKLAKYMDLRPCLVLGGLSLKVQEADLRQRPDLVVATPGRMLDHLRNSGGVHLDYVEILILDEADKLLELGFEETLVQIMMHLPKQRQTLLYSATLSDEIEQLASISLLKPKRISVDPFMGLATNLSQEFVRIRKDNEKRREAMVLSLCSRTYKDRVMIFCPTKIKAHKLKIIFALCELKAAELHGNLTQAQRMSALQSFREQEVDYLICTNLVARGIDVPNVQTVINMFFPKNLKTYVHRVGRTARAGKIGTAITLVGEDKRNFLKKLVKEAKTRGETLKSRVIDAAHVEEGYHRIAKLAPDIKQIFQEEMGEKQLRIAEMETNRALNLMVYEEEIKSAPKRTWFMSEKEKKNLRRLTTRIAKGDASVEDMKKPEKPQKSKREKRDYADQKIRAENQRELAIVKGMAASVKAKQKARKPSMALPGKFKAKGRKRRFLIEETAAASRIDGLGEKMAKKLQQEKKVNKSWGQKRKSKHKNRRKGNK